MTNQAADNKRHAKEKTVVADPQYWSSRLGHLYRVTKLLVDFDNAEKTVGAILSIMSNILPLRGAILIEKTAGEARLLAWNGEGESEKPLVAASNHALDSYSYLTGSDSTTIANMGRERPVENENSIVIPLVVGRRPIFGVFQLKCTSRCDETDLQFINAIANQLAVALDRHRAWQRETAARREAEANERRMRFLADASRLLAASFDYRGAWENVARLAVPEIADYCVIHILENQSLRPIVSLSSDRSPERIPEEAGAELAVVARRVFETRRPVIHPGAPSDSEVYQGTSFESYMCVPLRINGHALGTLTLVSARAAYVYQQNDLVLLEDLARRAVVAFENAQLYADALQAIGSRDDVLHAVSHDLKGPLTVVLAFVKMFLEKAKPEEPLICDRRQVEAIHRQAQQMNSLINDLLDTAKIEARHLYVDREICAVGPLIREAMDFPQLVAATKRLELRLDISSALPGVFVDRHRILQVFANLIGNAVKFTPSGGRIIVRAQLVGGEAIQFSVEDTGSGLSEEEIPHLFDRFWQARKTARQGTGLGLFIVKGIVEGHGGRIWVESKPGEGSTFLFTLPLMTSGEKGCPSILE